MHAVFFGETIAQVLFVFVGSPGQIAGHANMQRTVAFAGQDINEIAILFDQNGFPLSRE
jgi:hypothetical protein